MKPATPAPFYLSMYPALCDIARGHGYALTAHGTVSCDFDLVAVPWTSRPSHPDKMVAEMLARIHACLSPASTEEENGVMRIVWESKPHGRQALNLYTGHGTKIDLSVMPRGVQLVPEQPFPATQCEDCGKRFYAHAEHPAKSEREWFCPHCLAAENAELRSVLNACVRQ